MNGFLDPSGLFYECEHHDYVSFANSRLEIEYHNKSNIPVDRLCEFGWIVLQDSFIGFTNKDIYLMPNLTEKQKVWLEKNKGKMSSDQQYGLEICMELDKSLLSIRKLERKISKLKKNICSELQWKDSCYGTNLAQYDYEWMLEQCEVNILTEDEAKQLLENKFGFSKELVEIVSTAEAYKVNEKSNVIDIEKYERKPLYAKEESFYDSELSYILFRCPNGRYELINGSLNLYEDPNL